MKRLLFLFAMIALSAPSQAADPDTSVMLVKREADLVWAENPLVPGLKTAVLQGNPAAPGPYVIRVRFSPGVMSPPHFHPEERQVVVLKGTWWVGTGPAWDKEATVPMPAGSFAVHYPGKVHYDGAKDEEVTVQISGIGPSGTKLVDAAGQAK
jgi:quercetin dioxygenase-like cupin family protein